MRRALLLVSLVALLAGACSGDDNGAESGPDVARSEPSAAASEPDPEPDAAPDAPAAPPETPSDPAADAATAAVAVVRAWSTALNAGDNKSAAELFAPDALVIQGPNTLPLPDTAAAVRFNASLPCSGQIVDVTVRRDVVTAIFELGHRQASRCDAPPGTLAAADIIVEDGNIVLWQSVPVPNRGPDSSSAT